MVIKGLDKKIGQFFKKNIYIILVLIVGLLLMCFPEREKISVADTVNQAQPAILEKSISEELAEILSNVRGAGEVEVFLSPLAGEQTIYQTDEENLDSLDSSSLRIETVTVTNEQKADIGLVKQKIPATYKGAIVICHGADDPQVCLEIVKAVSNVTGLGADKISVLKMK